MCAAAHSRLRIGFDHYEQHYRSAEVGGYRKEGLLKRGKSQIYVRNGIEIAWAELLFTQFVMA